MELSLELPWITSFIGKDGILCLGLDQRVLSKFESWKEKLLYQAGKKALIKSIIKAVLYHAMLIVKFPKNLCHKLCSQVARFWWKKQQDMRNWADLCSGKIMWWTWIQAFRTSKYGF